LDLCIVLDGHEGAQEMSESSDSEAKGVVVVLLLGLSLIILAVLANLLSLRTYALSSEWALSLIAIVAVVALLVELLLSFHGLRRKYGLNFVLLLILVQAATASVADSIWEKNDMSGALILFVVATFFSMFGYILQSAVAPATKVLRSVKGFHASGKLDDSAVILKIPEYLLDKYGSEFLENRIGEELTGYLEEPVALVPAVQTKIGYSIARAQDERMLFRVEKAFGLVSVLFIRLDGIVCKFGEGKSVVKPIEFDLQTKFNLTEPTQEERANCLDDLTSAFKKYSKPLLDIHEIRAYFTKGVKIHRTRVALILAVVLVSALVFVDNPLVASLTGQKVLLWLALVSVIGSLAYLWELASRKEKDRQ